MKSPKQLLIKAATSVSEAYDHTGNEKLANFHDMTPATTKLSPNHADEHTHLAGLYPVDEHSPEHKAITGFTTFSHSLNDSLIKNTPVGIFDKGIHTRMMTMMDSNAPLTHEHHVYASLGNFNPKTVVGADGKFTTPAYMSTSLDPHVAASHANLRRQFGGQGDDSHVIHLTLPAGYKGGRYIGHVSRFQGEAEMVLRPHQHFKITGHEQMTLEDGSTRHVHHAVPLDHIHGSVNEVAIHSHHFFKRAPINRSRKPNVQLADGKMHRALYAAASEEHKEYQLPHDISPEEDYAQHKYAGSYSTPLNQYLIHTQAKSKESWDHAHPNGPAINHDSESLSDMDKHMTSLMSKAKPLTRDTHVYSGTGVYDPSAHFKEHGTIHLPAYTSTSFDPNVASSFTSRHRDDDPGEPDHHVIHFQLPTGYKNGISPRQDVEREYILNKGTKWTLTGHKKVVHKPEFGDAKGAIHIWSVKPHEDSLHEASFHTHHFFNAGKEGAAKNYLVSPLLKRSRAMLNQIRRQGEDDGRQEYSDHDSARSKWLPSHDPRHNSLYKYTGAYSKLVNRHLINGELPLGTSASTLHEHITNIKSAIAEAPPLSNETHVYSGLGYNPTEHFKTGVIHTPAFTSTSFKPNVATFFGMTNDEGKMKHHHIIHFHLPAGYRGGISPPQNSGEAEFILDAGQHWKLTNHRAVVSKPSHGHMTTHIWSVEPHTKPVHERYNPFTAWTNNSKNVNKGLATGTLSRGQIARATRMSNLMQTHEGAPTVVYHGTKDRGFAVGQTYTPKAFVSASTDEHTATRFSMSHAIEAGKVDSHILAITVHPGAKALHIGNDQSSYDEHEVVLQHGQPMHIERHDVKHVTHPNTKQVHTVHIWHASLKPSLTEAYKHDDKVTFKTQKTIMDLDWGDTDHWMKGHRKEHKHLSELHRVADPAHHQSIESFTGASGDINHDLIHNKMDDYHAPIVKHMKALTKDAPPLQQEHHVYSSTGSFDPSTIMRRGVFKTPAFMSTSINPTVAAAHRESNSSGPNGKTHIMHFTLPKGYSKGRYIAPHSQYPDEAEFVLHPNQKWKVNGSTQKGSTTVWHVSPHEDSLNETTYHDPAFLGHDSNNNTHMLKDVEKQHETMAALPGPRASESELISVCKYQGKHSPTINSHLIKQHTGKSIATRVSADKFDPEEHGVDVSNISKFVTSGHPLHETVHTYSGLGAGFDPTKHFQKNNGVIHTPAFTSTSINPVTAKRFGKWEDTGHKEKTQHIIHFQLPKGYSKGRYLQGKGHNLMMSHEQEFLLDKGQSWKLVEHHTIEHQFANIHNLKTHIWSVVPHESTLKEASFHSKNFFRSVEPKRGYAYNRPESERLQAYQKASFEAHESHMDDVQAQHERLMLHQNNHHHLWTPHARNSVSEYTVESSPINKALIRGKPEPHHDPDIQHELNYDHNALIGHAQHISKTIEQHANPLPEEVHVYSGMKSFNPAKTVGVGSVFKTPAFTSASIRPLTALGFSGVGLRDTSNTSERHVLHFHLPAGYKKGMYIDHISENKGEKEFLLDRGQQWKVVKHERVPQRIRHGYQTSHINIWSVVPHEG